MGAELDYWTIMMTVLPPLEVAWVAIAAIYIILQRRSAPATMAWILALAFFPLIGIAFYMIFGPRRFERRKTRRRRARGAVLESYSRVDEPLSTVLERETDVLGLLELIESSVGRAGLPRVGELEIYFDGKAKYEALVSAIGEAGRHIHLEYYIWEPDQIGTRIRDALCERAKDGVEVRVLVDGFGSSKAAARFWEPLRAAGGKVRRFNELSIYRWRPRMANFRTHRKIAVIDGVVAFTGGMNITDVHSEEFSGDKAWRDTHMRVKGPVAKGLQLVFFEDWHYAGGDAPNVERYLPEPGSLERVGCVMQVVSSGPDEGLDAIHKAFFVAISGARKRVQLTTPYFVPDQTIVNALNAAALRGAEVTVLVPEGGDQPFVAAAARSYYPELLESGVRIFEYGEPVLHAKTLVVDDVSMIGTANVDNRSFRLNFEVVVTAYDEVVSEQLSTQFLEDLENAREVTLRECKGWPLLTRLTSSTARLFSPLL